MIQFNYIIQNIATGNYKTETGWNSNIAQAKKFTGSTEGIAATLPNGDYAFIPCVTLSDDVPTGEN